MNDEIDGIIIELEILASKTEDDFKNKFWANYERYLVQYNALLTKLHNVGLFYEILPIEKVPDGKKDYLGRVGTQEEQAKLREISNSSQILLQKIKTKYEMIKNRNMPQINKEKMEQLNSEAEEIIGLSRKFFSSITIQTNDLIISSGSRIPKFEGGYMNTEPPVKYYSWGELSTEISELQLELLRKYDLWYKNSEFIIRKFLNHKLEEFIKSHEEGEKYIKLDYSPCNTKGTESFYKFMQYFNIERNIVSLIFPMVEDYKKTNKKIIQEESINLGQRLKAEQIIKKWLNDVQGDVYCWLNYIDETTIGYLNDLPRTSKVRIITSEIQENNNEFKKAASRFGKAHPKLEVKIVRVKTEIPSGVAQDFSEGKRAIIHKRKLISNNIMIDFGTDLKSSALGNTKHDMALREVDPSIKEEFDKEWNREEAEWMRIEGIPIRVTYYAWPET